MTGRTFRYVNFCVIWKQTRTICSGQLSLVPLVGREMSSSLRAIGQKYGVADLGGGMSASLSVGLHKKLILELRRVICHLESHIVTCIPPDTVNVPSHNSSQIGRYSIYLPRMDERLSRH